MRRQTALPRIAREGWVPAGPEKRVNKRAMLIPKTGQPSDHLPTLLDFSETICPPERRALRDHDEEPDAPGLRRRFIAERQGPPRQHRYVDQDGRECRVLDPSRYDATKDDEELRKAQRWVNALAAQKRKRVKA